MDKTLLKNLEDGITMGLFTFIGNNGYRFTKDELIDLLKEVVYVAEEKILDLGTKEDIKSFKNDLIEDLKENTSFYED